MTKPNILIAMATVILGGPGKGLEQFLCYGGIEGCNPFIVDYILKDETDDTEFVRVMRNTGATIAPIYQKKMLDWHLVEQGMQLIQKHNIQILQSHGYKSHMLCYLLHRKTKLPWISVVEGWTRENFKIHCYTALEHILIHGSTEIVAVSESLRSRLLPLARKRCHVIPNAISVDELKVSIPWQEMRQKLHIAQDALVFGTLGRLSPEKNLELFLRAFAEVKKSYPNAHALIAGEGQEKQKLESLAQELHIDKDCSFVGHISDTANYYNIIDIQVMPSLTEGMPYAALEGMCMKRPLVASNAGGIPEVVIDQETGLLFPSEDLTAFTKALLDLAGNPEKRQYMGQASKERIDKFFSPHARTQQFLHLYNNNIK